MRTGNAILDVLIRVVAIALIAAIIVWILGVLDAPSIVGTIIWILALLTMVVVIFPLVMAGLGGGSPGAEHPREPAAPGGRPRTDEPTESTRRPPPPPA